MTRVEELLGKVTGQPCQLRIEASSGGDSPAGPAEDARPLPSRYRRQRAEATQAPLVKRAIELLGAQIVQVDDGFGTAPAEPEPVDRPEEDNSEES